MIQQHEANMKKLEGYMDKEKARQELEEKAEERRWAPAPSPLMTRWSKDVSPDMVPEYPRPMLLRGRTTDRDTGDASTWPLL